MNGVKVLYRLLVDYGVNVEDAKIIVDERFLKLYASNIHQVVALIPKNQDMLKNPVICYWFDKSALPSVVHLESEPNLKAFDNRISELVDEKTESMQIKVDNSLEQLRKSVRKKLSPVGFRMFDIAFT